MVGTYCLSILNRNRLVNIENKLVFAKGNGGGGGMDEEFGVHKCKLLHLE